jgi:hypothetical protein
MRANAGSPSSCYAIILPAGGVALTIPPSGSDTAAEGDLDITAANLSISGTGADTTGIYGNGNSRIFEIKAANVYFSDLELTDAVQNGADGGAIRVSSGQSLTLSRVWFEDNHTDRSGAGVFNSGTLTVTNSVFMDNVANENGGAIFNAGTLAINNSTFWGNYANSLDDGGHPVSDYGGGGIINWGGGTINLNNVTIVQNYAQNGGLGGDIYRRSDAGAVYLKNTLIGAGDVASCQGALTSQGHNLLSVNTGCSGLTDHVNGDLVGTPASPVDPVLQLPAPDGHTYTCALTNNPPLWVSAAIDAGDNATCMTTDQRGIKRAGNGSACDIGAYELVQEKKVFLPVVLANTAPPVTQPPQAPSNLTGAATSSTSLVLNWQVNSNNETGFVVEEQLESGAFTALPILAAGTNSLTRTGRQAGKHYTYHVRAVNSAGSSAWSNLWTVTTPPSSPPAGQLPAPPSNLRAGAISVSEIELFWDNPATNATGVILEESPDGVNFTRIYTGTGPTDTHATISGLDPVTTLNYRVRTYNAAGESVPSNIAGATTWGTTAPAAPTNLVATAQSSSVIRLTFDHPGTNVEGFMLSISQDNITWFTDFFTFTVKIVDVTALEPSHPYWFRVDAFNHADGVNLHVSGFASASATTQASGDTTRFINYSSYPIISLKINGVEKISAPNAIGAGAYYEMPLTVGNTYNVAWTNGFWTGTEPNPMYGGGGTFVQGAGTTTYAINNPSLGRILAHRAPVGSWGYWLGEVWSGTSLHSYGYCFKNDSDNPGSASTFKFYIDGVYQSGGSASIPSGGYPNPGTFIMHFQTLGDSDHLASLYEPNGPFDMHNGPSDWRWVEYAYAGGTCPN